MIRTDAVELAWGACTDRGLRRKVNEDSFVAEAPLFLVADGMGGHEGGAEASARAIASFRELLGTRVDAERVQSAFERAVRGVDAIPTQHDAAGTTMSGAILFEQDGEAYWLILNVGDSRTYRLLNGILSQISVDHSAVQALLDSGQISAADAERHPQRSVITRALGAGSTSTPDYWLLPIVQGERLLICSDGLTKEVPVELLAEVLRAEPSAQAAATRLVHHALLNGGRDNVTVIVVDALRVTAVDDEPTSGGDADEDTRPNGLDDTRPNRRSEERTSDADVQQG